MKKLSLLIASILLITLWISCQKERYNPDYHVDVFRCKVNGEEWVATCTGSALWGCDAIDCQYFWKDTKSISISAVRRLNNDSTYQSMRLYKYNSDIGLNQLDFTTREYTDWNKISGCRLHNLDTNDIRNITILEVDTINYRIKGTFEFTAINECQDTIRITDGYFHVNYRF